MEAVGQKDMPRPCEFLPVESVLFTRSAQNIVITHLDILQSQVLSVRAAMGAELRLDSCHVPKEGAHCSDDGVEVEVCVVATYTSGWTSIGIT